MRIRSWLLITAAAGALNACSPYVYKSEIQGFAEGLDAVDENLAASLNAVATGRIAGNHLRWQNRRSRVALSQGCVLPTATASESCGLQDVSTSIVAEPGPSGEEREAAAVLAESGRRLRRYAKGLAAITAAEDREAFDHAVAQLGDAVEELGGAATVAPTLSPLVELAGLIGGSYLDRRRLVTLETMVVRADPHIDALAANIADSQLALRTSLLGYLSTQSDYLHVRISGGTQRKLSDEAYDQSLMQLEELATTINELDESDPQETADLMSAAHHELRSALENNKGQSAAVVGAIRKFLESIDAVRSATGLAATTASGV